MAETANIADAALRKEYSSFISDLWLRRTRTLCLIAIAAIPSGVVLDWYIYGGEGGHFRTFLISRIARSCFCSDCSECFSESLLTNLRCLPTRLNYAICSRTF